ncbi:MAG: DUF3987 domain-containing protein [Trichodesmium sp. MO_231.B1]|nr:DUF3987 domain-containing protein [Trichodesmium sp. MO_231.B1]
MTIINQESKNSNTAYSDVRDYLTLLGYNDSDTVFFRAINDGGARKSSYPLNKIDYNALQKSNSQGSGIYIVVNGGGNTDADVKQCRAIFYEHDNLPKDEQKQLWQKLSLPEPTFQVDTGGKSIHSYWVFDKPSSVEDWKTLQTDLLEYSDGDRSIKNPSRVMRVPGFVHQKSGNKSEIVSQSSKRYSYKELRQAIPTQQTQTLNFSQPSTTYLDSVPLENCLTQDDMALIDSGEVKGGRDNAGAKLARNLIGTAKRLDYLGYSYRGDPRKLFDDYCSRCTPPLDIKEANRIWRSAEKSNPTSTLTDDFLKSSVERESKNKSASDSSKFSINNNTTDKEVALSDKQLKQEITKLINTNEDEVSRDLKLLNFSQEYKIPYKQIQDIAEKILRQLDSDDEKKLAATEASDLQNIRSESINLDYIFEGKLPEIIKNQAQGFGTKPEAFLIPLLAVSASLQKTDRSLVLRSVGKAFKAYSIFFGGNVGDSGSMMKTPIMQVFLDPLYELQTEVEKTYRQQLLDYEKAKAEGSDDKTEPPKTYDFILSDATIEAVDKAVSNHPEYGHLMTQDELAGLIKSANKYKNGKGSDAEKILEARDGSPIKVDRASGKRIYVSNPRLSIFGNIQPSVLRDLMGDDDENGYWARFIWYNLPEADCKYYTDVPHIDPTDYIRGIYKKIREQDNIEARLSPEAEKLYARWFDYLGELAKKETSQPSKSFLAKLKRVTGELALIVATINAAATGKKNIPEVFGVEDIRRGIKLAKFFLSQLKLYRVSSDKSSKSGQYDALIEFSKKHGWLKAATVKQNIRAFKKKSSEEIRRIFLEMNSTGIGQIEGTGNRLTWRYNSSPVQTLDTLDNAKSMGSENSRQTIDTTLDKNFNAVSTDLQGIEQPTGTTLDTLDDFSDDNQDFESHFEVGDLVIDSAPVQTPENSRQTVDTSLDKNSNAVSTDIQEIEQSIVTLDTIDNFSDENQDVESHFEVGDLVIDLSQSKDEKFTIVNIQPNSPYPDGEYWIESERKRPDKVRGHYLEKTE